MPSNTPDPTMQSIDLWALVEDIPTRAPLDKVKLEQALRTVLIQDERITNEYATALKGGPVQLAQGIQIQAISFRFLAKAPLDQWLLSLSMGGQCVARRDVLARYPKLVVTGHPRGGSLDEETYYSTTEPWGKVSFGFAERNFECLSSVLFSGPKW